MPPSKNWGSEVYERINGKWERKCDLKIGGKVHYIGSEKLQITTDVFEFNSNQTFIMTSKCIRIKSPILKNNNIQGSNLMLNITFPEANCWNISLKFLEQFNLMADSSIKLNLIYSNSTKTNVGRFSGDNSLYNEDMKFIQSPPVQIVQVYFKNGGSQESDDFILKVCKTECCYEYGFESYWYEWNDWSYVNTCPFGRSNYLQIQKRNCKVDCDCNKQDTKVDAAEDKSKIYYKL